MTINRNLSILAGGVSSTGVLGVPNGGSGATTLTGYLIGNGTSAFTASATIPTSSLSGTLNIANGGTGQTTASTAFNALSPLTTAGDTLYGGVSGAGTRLGIGTAGQVLTVNSGATAPQWTTLSGVAVTTFQTSLSGLTPSTATNGAITLAGTLGVASGGTGATTLTGYVYGNGIGAMTASTTIPTSALSGTVSLTTQVSDILPIANGGTAQSSFTTGYVHYGSFSTSANLTFNGTQLATTRLLASGNYATNAGDLTLTNTNGGRSWRIGDGIGGFPTSLIFWDSTGAAVRMAIGATGGVSIGNTTDPGAGSLNVNNYLNVGTTTSLAKLTVNNGNIVEYTGAWRNDNATTQYFHSFNYNGNEIGSIKGSNTSTAYLTSSDYRLKENIAPMTGALNVIQQLRPVTYNWKLDGSSGQGFIAHELQNIIPDCVVGAKDAVDSQGNPIYQGIDTSFLVATLVSAIQELNNKLDAYVASHS